MTDKTTDSFGLYLAWQDAIYEEALEHIFMTDLFGHDITDKLPGGAMCQRFIEPPFRFILLMQ